MVFPDEKRLLDGRLIFQLEIHGVQQAGNNPLDLGPGKAIPTAQHPFHFLENELAHENAAARQHFSFNPLVHHLELLGVFSNEEAHKSVGVDPEHQIDNCTMGTAARPSWYNIPAGKEQTKKQLAIPAR